MAERPKSLVFLALAFVGMTLAMPGQIMLIYGHGLEEWTAIAAKLSLFNRLVMVLLVLNSALLWRASPYLRFSIPILVIAVAINNFFVGYYATDFSPSLTLAASFGFAALCLPVLQAEIRFLILHPEQRWWLRAKRKRMVVPVFIEGTRLDSLKVQSYDVSETGVFVPVETRVGVGDLITVRLKFGTFFQLRCQGRVVRRGEARGTYPAGVGIHFTDISWRQRRELRRHLAKSPPDEISPF